MNSHLRRAVDLETGIDGLNQTNDADVLNDCRVNSGVDRVTKKVERVLELGRLYEGVERQIDPRPARVSEAACDRDLLQRELSTLITSVESLCAEVNGVGAIRNGSTHGIERARRGQQLRDLVLLGHNGI